MCFEVKDGVNLDQVNRAIRILYWKLLNFRVHYFEVSLFFSPPAALEITLLNKLKAES